MQLDSDVIAPDSRLIARFYSRSVKQGFLSDEAGHPVFRDVDYVEICAPGDTLNIIDVPVRDDHKQRFPVQWQHYLKKTMGNTAEAGTQLDQWPALTPAQCEELRALKFYTVEAIAGASDAALSKMGMLAGKSPYTFRDEAGRFLQVVNDSKALSRMEEEKKAMADQIAEMKEMLEKLTKPPEETKKGK